MTKRIESITVGQYYEELISNIDNAISPVSAIDILNTNEGKDSILNGMAPQMLQIELIKNFILLFPQLHKTNGFTKDKEKDSYIKLGNELVRIIPSLFIDATGNIKNEKKRGKDLQSLRNTLEHGNYEICYDSSTKQIYLLAHGIKITIDTIMDLCEVLISKYLEPNNRVQLAIINNMKVINAYITKYNKINTQTNQKNKHEFNHKFLKPQLLITNQNSKYVIEDMHKASLCSLFYSTYQYSLENKLWVPINIISTAPIDNLKSTILKGEYFDFTKLDIPEKLYYNDTFVGKQKDIKSKLRNKCITEFYAKQYQDYKENIISKATMIKRCQTYGEFLNKYFQYIENAQIIHRIRNAIAHGNVMFGANHILLKDEILLDKKDAASLNDTFNAKITTQQFRRLVCGNNMAKIKKHLQKSA